MIYLAGKPFIELSVFKTQSVRSNTIEIKYFFDLNKNEINFSFFLKRYLKLLIQEFVACVDQGLILAIIAFIETEKVN